MHQDGREWKTMRVGYRWRKVAAAFFSDRRRRCSPDHTSPTFEMRAGMLRRVNEVGATAPRSTSSQVTGADTGAPGLARTV